MIDPEERSSALAVRHLSKTFAGSRVLTDVSFDVEAGEVHALLGQNGSGKSTLIKCLAGVHRADPGGSIDVSGRALPHTFAPNDVGRFGLGFVHQDLGLIPDMTVEENLAIGSGFERTGPLIRWRSQSAHARRVLENFGLTISPRARVRDLPVTSRTLMAIARAFQPRESDETPLACLVLDEPTAALPDNDAELLFEAIGRVTAAGVGVVYVTHRLEEVHRLAGRATILRDGVHVGTVDVHGTSRHDLVTAIVGEREAEIRGGGGHEPGPSGAPDGTSRFRGVGLRGRRIRDVDLELHAGEIVGLAGLAGTGRSELARLMFGSQPLTGGTRFVDGQPLPAGGAKQAMAAGIAMVPEDRRRDGCVLTMSITENLTLVTLIANRVGLLNLRTERERTREAIDRFDIRPTDPRRHLSTLSGGNQQKVVLAKWLARRPRVLILDEPVQGVDVGAKADIFAQLRSAAESGTAVLVIDSDFDNLVELCHRVLVLHRGTVIEEVGGANLTATRLSQATFGIPDENTDVSMSAGSTEKA